MKIWPSSLPQFVQRNGYFESPRMPRATFTPDSGTPVERPKGTMRWTVISCSMRMTTAQLDLFEDFVVHDLKRGTAEFLMPHPRKRDQVTARLAGENAWRASPAGGITWIVALELMVKD